MKSRLFVIVFIYTVFIGIKEASAQTKKTKTKYEQQYKIINPVGVPDTTSFKFQPDDSKGRTLLVYHYAAVDLEPSFPGGEDVFASSYLTKKIHVTSAIRGRVIISFIVKKNGSLTNFNIVRGINKDADQEVIRVMKKSPKWLPGKKNGKIVNVLYILPVKVNL